MMFMCRVFSCVAGRGCLLWPVRSLGKTLLAFALLHSVLQGQICLLLQVFLDLLHLHCTHCYIQNRHPTRMYCTELGTLLNVICQSGWDRGFEEKYMCMYGWVPSLLTWNYHSIVNWLHPNTKGYKVWRGKKNLYAREKNKLWSW